MNPDLPPPNRAIGWYRFMLWMMPTCIALTTACGFGWLASAMRLPYHNLMLYAWFFFNIATTVGIGCFEVKLRNSDPSLRIRTRAGVIGFFLLQFLIIPVFSFVIFFAACLFAGY